MKLKSIWDLRPSGDLDCASMESFYYLFSVEENATILNAVKLRQHFVDKLRQRGGWVDTEISERSIFIMLLQK